MQKALTQMNLQLHRVTSDLSGVSGLAIVRAIVAGEPDPHKLVGLKPPLIRCSDQQLFAALSGDYRAEHVFVLAQELSLYEVYQTQIAQCDQQIEQCLATLEDQSQDRPPLPPRTKGKRPSRHGPTFDLRGELFRISGVDFTSIDGLDALTVQTSLSEVGLDPTQFPTMKHFASWLGLYPGNPVSDGKSKSTRTRRVVN